MCFVLGHITAYGRFSDKRKCGLSLISCQRMYPGDQAREILPCGQNLKRNHLILRAEQRKTNSNSFFLSLVFFSEIWYLLCLMRTIFACQLGERTVRIRKVKGSNPSVSTTGPRTFVLGPFTMLKLLVFLRFFDFRGIQKIRMEKTFIAGRVRI